MECVCVRINNFKFIPDTFADFILRLEKVEVLARGEREWKIRNPFGKAENG